MSTVEQQNAALQGPEDVLNLLRDVFERRGAESYLGEDVTMSQHMLQGAALVGQQGFGDAVVVAALLHDIGHYINDFPEADALRFDRRHQVTGAAILTRWFPPIVVECVRGHVDAKRYLCAAEPDYLRTLSDASIQTLELQGGIFDDRETRLFAQSPYLDDMLAVRRADDAGKDRNAEVPGFAIYGPAIMRLMREHERNGDSE